MVLVKDVLTQADIDRILNSETFRNAEVLRRLLRFLGEKAISGDADQLKEYTIGIDALGKPATYDPRQDSSVRIQVGRLRQKLAEYYRAEGKSDPLIIDLPKGHFRLSWEAVPQQTESLPPIPPALYEQPRTTIAAPGDANRWRNAAMALGILLVLAVIGWAYTRVQLASEKRQSAESRLTPELEELWKPFLTSERPLTIAVASPMFVGFEGAGLFRDPSINTWADAEKSPRIQSLLKMFHAPGMTPVHYAGPGEISAVYHLGPILGSRASVTRADQLSQQQLSDGNLILLGAPRVYRDQLAGLPDQLEFVLAETGITNLHPRAGESAFLADHYPNINFQAAQPDNGEIYAMVTHVPGPLGVGDIEIFTANHNPGTLAAVEWFTQRDLAKELVGRLRKPTGEIPRFFQVVLKVKYKDAIPTDVSYVMHRELPSGARSGSH